MAYDMNIGSEDFNYTCNGNKMWYEAVEKLFKLDSGIRFIYGLRGEDVKHRLIDVLGWILKNRELCESYQSGNGWGTVDDGIEFLLKLIKASHNNPDEIWEGD